MLRALEESKMLTGSSQFVVSTIDQGDSTSHQMKIRLGRSLAQMTTLRDRVDSIAVIGTMQMGRGIVVESWSINDWETGATETRMNGSHRVRERANQTSVIVTILR